jgi:hypothetical protein
MQTEQKQLDYINRECNTNYTSLDEVDWLDISFYGTLSEDFIRKFQDKVNWNCISQYQKLSEDFIREYQDKAYYRAVELQRAAKNELLSSEFYNMVRCYGWELTDDDNEYVYRLSNSMLEHLIQINRGRYKFKRLHR